MKKYSKVGVNELSLPSKILTHLLFVITCTLCFIPFIFIVSASFSLEADLSKYGFTLIPRHFTLNAYRLLMGNSAKDIINAYLTTIFTTTVGATIGTVLVTMTGYALSRDLKYKSHVSFLIYFTMMFSGGMVSWYLVCTQLLHLQDTIWALIIPSILSPWNIIMMRTFIKSSVPYEIIESVKMDGASELVILFRFVMPLAKPGVATIALFMSLYYWNDWYLPMMLINRSGITNLQFYMQRIFSSVQMLTEYAKRDGAATINLADVGVPRESMRMAVCLLAMGPILLAAPFFQKYIIKGITIGSVKG